MNVAADIERIVGPEFPIAIRACDVHSLGPADSPTTLLIRSPDAFRRIPTTPGELGPGRVRRRRGDRSRGRRAR